MIFKIEQHKDLTFVSLFVLLTLLPFFLYLRGSLGVDESYFMVIGNSILHGSIPYKDYMDMKPPGIYYLFALTFSIFGKSFYAARAVLFLFNALSAVIIFLIGKKLWNKEAGMLSSILFLIGMLIPAYEGYFAMTEPFMVFFGLLGVLLFFKSEHWLYLIFCGILMGLSILFKQSGVLFLAAIFIFYLIKLWIPANRTKFYLKDSLKNLSLIICGFSIPILLVAFYFWSVGALNSFFYLSFLFAITEHYGRELVFDKQTIIALTYKFLSYSIVWLLSFVSIFIIVYALIKKEAKDIEIFTVIWFIISLYPLTIRTYGHYFIQIIPPACLLASISLIRIYPILSLKSIKESLSNANHLKIFAIICILLITLASIGAVCAGGYRLQKTRQIHFDEQLKTAEYIKSHTSSNEKILSLYYEPSIYFLSDRKSVTKWLTIHESVTNDTQVIQQIKENNVRYIICDFRLYKEESTQTRPIYAFILENYELEKSIGVFYIYRKKG